MVGHHKRCVDVHRAVINRPKASPYDFSSSYYEGGSCIFSSSPLTAAFTVSSESVYNRKASQTLVAALATPRATTALAVRKRRLPSCLLARPPSSSPQLHPESDSDSSALSLVVSILRCISRVRRHLAFNFFRFPVTTQREQYRLCRCITCIYKQCSQKNMNSNNSGSKDNISRHHHNNILRNLIPIWRTVWQLSPLI